MSNVIHFDGRMADAATLTRHGESAVVNFTLIRNEYAGKDEGGNSKERKVAVRFAIWGARAEWLAKNTRKGDQLIVEARLENENWTDKDGNEHYSYGFVVRDVSRGALGPESRELVAKRVAAKSSSKETVGVEELDDIPL